MRPSVIQCSHVQFDAAKSNWMQPSAIQCGQVQFDATKSNSRPRVILCSHK
ncbi:hypothetical protein RHMOL_Rhmol05G0252200 [Rhododendron molle]|uniref:Uncharacterized protein n=1 Tax=Rhododendron molle TaxID=49168 RepID=A0ACC0NTY5_RHOML|nr:hypothetical protein RHMOL_Rhmol05G0252200 [Rhododendron molle]